MGFNNGKIALYNISYLKFEGDILEDDNVFRRENISCLCDITDVFILIILLIIIFN